jgi:TolA-binding protein
MGQRADTMVSISDLDDDRSRRRPQTPAGPPAWSGWLQIGLSTMLAVLFLVMLAKTREQNQLLRQLEQRVQGLENSRALDRTSVLEEQQRAMLQRLQPLEAGARRLEAIEQQQEQWRQALADLQNRARRRPEPSLEPFPSPPMPSPAAGGKSAPSQTPRGDGGVLRPPAPGSP